MDINLLNRIYFLFISLIISFSVSAADCRVHGQVDRFSPVDPHIYYKNEKMCLFVKLQRSIKSVARSEVVDLIPDELMDRDLSAYHFVANFAHDGKHYLALIPKEPEFVSLQFLKRDNNNPIDKAHSQMRIGLHADNPLLLIDQQQKGSMVKPLVEFVASFEAIPVYKGPRLGALVSLGNPFKAKSTPFGFGLRFFSAQTNAETNKRKKKFPKDLLIYERGRLNHQELSGPGLLDSLLSISKRFEKMQLEHYHLTKLNCTNSLLGVLDQTIERTRKIFDGLLGTSPNFMKLSLRKRKIPFEEISAFSHPQYYSYLRGHQGCFSGVLFLR